MDHEIIEQVLYDPTGSTRRDSLRRITMTYALDSGEGEWMKTSDKVNAALREALVAKTMQSGFSQVPMMRRSPSRGSATTSFTYWTIVWKNSGRSPA